MPKSAKLTESGEAQATLGLRGGRCLRQVHGRHRGAGAARCARQLAGNGGGAGSARSESETPPAHDGRARGGGDGAAADARGAEQSDTASAAPVRAGGHGSWTSAGRRTRPQRSGAAQGATTFAAARSCGEMRGSRRTHPAGRTRAGFGASTTSSSRKRPRWSTSGAGWPAAGNWGLAGVSRAHFRARA